MLHELVIHTKADTEYDQYLNADRSTAYDVGNHFRVLESIVIDGFSDGVRPVHIENGCDIYLFFGSRVLMFISVHHDTLLLAHLRALGTEYEQAKALTEAIGRSIKYFDL